VRWIINPIEAAQCTIRSLVPTFIIFFPNSEILFLSVCSFVVYFFKTSSVFWTMTKY